MIGRAEVLHFRWLGEPYVRREVKPERGVRSDAFEGEMFRR